MFAAIAAVIVIVVVCCVLFMVGAVEVETVIGLSLTDEEEKQIIAVSGISSGQSVFSVDESAAANAIEKAYPTLGVVTIERVFPNKVDIKITSRTGVAAGTSKLRRAPALRRSPSPIPRALPSSTAISRLSALRISTSWSRSR